MRTVAQSALTITLAAALLAGCGGSQPPIGAPRVTPPMPTIASARGAAHHPSASYQQLYRFGPAQNGAGPEGGLVDVSGTLYGTTTVGGGGHNGKGTVYSISTSGEHKVRHRFQGDPDGRDPESGLLNVNGTLYGTTEYGGPGGRGGTVYSISTSGTEKVLYTFKGGSDGCRPGARLIYVNGTLYGTTTACGNFKCNSAYGCGTVFGVTTSGQETVLHIFTGCCSDGAMPQSELIAVDGVLYGTTPVGGLNKSDSGGTVFSITPAGVEKVLYTFQGGSDGATPLSGLINVKGRLYGTTSNGGHTKCECGTVYRVSTTGAEKVLYAFAGGSDGANPASDLTEMNGVLYGTTQGGGNSKGTIFKVSASGRERVVYRFGAIPNDGAVPSSYLTNLNGTLYGTTY